MEALKKVVVVGVGLIGGSFALALRNAGAAGRIVGVGRDPENLKLALARGAIDEMEHDVAKAVRDADFVLLAVPVGATKELLARMASALSKHTLISDGGSTKSEVIEAARAALGARIGQFVPAHPIAGSEQSGVGAATSELYRGREVIVTPLAENSAEAVARVRSIWAMTGARISEMDAMRHDAILAAVSHLPHWVAFAFMDALAKRENVDTLLSHAGGGFRDFTRLAASHPRMWADICLSNKSALLNELGAFEQALKELRQLLQGDAAAELEERFANARALREAWGATLGRSAAEGE